MYEEKPYPFVYRPSVLSGHYATGHYAVAGRPLDCAQYRLSHYAGIICVCALFFVPLGVLAQAFYAEKVLAHCVLHAVFCRNDGTVDLFPVTV